MTDPKPEPKSDDALLLSIFLNVAVVAFIVTFVTWKFSTTGQDATAGFFLSAAGCAVVSFTGWLIYVLRRDA